MKYESKQGGAGTGLCIGTVAAIVQWAMDGVLCNSNPALRLKTLSYA